MNFNQINCFIALSETLNYTQTADSLHVTQSMLSRTINSLEEEIGFKLFIRNTRNVTLTDTGKRFLSTCKQLSEVLGEGIKDAALAEKGYVGDLRIGYLKDTYDAASVNAINNFTRQHPMIHIELVECSYSNLHQYFINQSIDAVLGTGLEFSDASRENEVVLFEIQDCLACSPTHPFASRKEISFKELKNEDFVVISRASAPFRHDHLFQLSMNAGFIPNIVAQASFIQGIFMLVGCNIGISILPKNLSYMSEGCVCMVPINDIPKRRWSLIWSSENQSASLQLFIASVKAFVEKKAGGERTLSVSGRDYRAVQNVKSAELP